MTKSVSPRAEVLATPLAHHGAFDYRELETLGLDPAEILDFSTNINPYGPTPMAAKAIEDVPLERLPDRDSLTLRRALADQLALSPDQIVTGNGSAELLWLIAFAFIHPGDCVVIVGPTFGEYARCASLMGAQTELISTRADRAFAVEPECVERTLRLVQPQLVFVCNPNNPTGAVIEPAVIGRWADQHPGILFVVDEAYLPFSPDLQSVLSLNMPNVLALRSLTKDYALAGLRLGYAAGSHTVIDGIVRARPPWNVNALAQAAGLAALRDQAHLQNTLVSLQAAKAELVQGLQRLDLAPFPSATHYFVIDVGNGTSFRRRLLAQRVQVRDCASFGMPAHVRIATRRPEENAQLLAAVEVTKP